MTNILSTASYRILRLGMYKSVQNASFLSKFVQNRKLCNSNISVFVSTTEQVNTCMRILYTVPRINSIKLRQSNVGSTEQLPGMFDSNLLLDHCVTVSRGTTLDLNFLLFKIVCASNIAQKKLVILTTNKEIANETIRLLESDRGLAIYRFKDWFIHESSQTGILVYPKYFEETRHYYKDDPICTIVMSKVDNRGIILDDDLVRNMELSFHFRKTFHNFMFF
ncbi:hypothetical protein PFISCL1PPCAC_8888 [Pristionchus fissidentatus]|uniref:Uncharacterized protein n=1 Tax=Pristionchus fissidentatus TaxID=1538716 RepID=A0AAV5VE02_9BILA|nr:hypothetical protein PFISCL1PPCAC_8888 [Pristionchus fissidentatus]